MRNGRGSVWVYSAIIMLLGIVSILIVGSIGKPEVPYAFESEAGIDPVSAYESYRANPTNEALYEALLGLCREMAAGQTDHDSEDRFCELGRELYRRAKAEMLDLKTIGDPNGTLHMLDLLNQNGISANNT